MNEFETYEVIKLLEEYPKNKYKDSKNRIIENIEGKVVVTFEGTFKSLDINETWTQLQEPKYFMEAINSCKKIRFKYNGYGSDYKYVSDILGLLYESYVEDEIVTILNKKCWYIEED